MVSLSTAVKLGIGVFVRIGVHVGIMVRIVGVGRSVKVATGIEVSMYEAGTTLGVLDGEKWTKLISGQIITPIPTNNRRVKNANPPRINF